MRAISQTLRRVVLLTALALVSIPIGCRAPSSSPPPPAPIVAPPTSSTPPAPADQQGPPIQPDPQLTPGATLAVTTDDICVPGYTQVVRDVPAAVKRQVYAEYGITHHEPGEYEVDHLISLELGGSNSLKNLWPQSYETQPWNAHVKDALEDELHRLVCSGQLDLKTAQHEIATDWIGAYKKYFQTDRPLTSTRASRRRRRPAEGELSSGSEPLRTPATPEAPSNPASGTQPETGLTRRVWVNTRSGKYFRPGSRYYGQTKEGQYMTETEARKLGYAAAQGD
jgi:hypothetical protein